MTPVPSWLGLLPVVADAVPDLSVWVLDSGHRFVLCQGPWPASRGLTAADVLGRPLRDVVLPAFGDRVDALLTDALAGRPGSAELAVDDVRAPGRPRAVWEVRVTPLRSPDGEPLALCTGRDVVRQRTLSAASASNERRFRTAFDAAPTAMALLAGRGAAEEGLVPVRVNAALAALVGRPAADLVGRDPTPVAGTALRDLVRRALAGDPGPAVDSWLAHADGSRVPVSAACSPPVPVVADDGSTHTELVLLLHDTTAERDTHRALREALAGERRVVEHLRRLEDLRGDFVAAVSHELRTPLTSILGNLEMLLDGDGGPLSPMQALMLATVENESQRLRRLIEDLLTTAHVQAGTAPAPEDVELDLALVVAEAAAEVAGQLSRRGQQLVTDTDGPAPVRGDAVQLRGVVAELLSNAAKVSPPGGRVRLSCTREDGAVVVRVADGGPGIPEAELPFVFDRFFRTAHAGAQALPGTGLGLSLVAHTVTAHGGTVRADSGVTGAVFTVRLPAAGTPAHPHLAGSPA